MQNKVVSHEDWLKARLELLAAEKEFTRQRDALTRRRMAMPYSCYGRGVDMLNGAYNYLDLAPKGRDEDGLKYPMACVRRHDRY